MPFSAHIPNDLNKRFAIVYKDQGSPGYRPFGELIGKSHTSVKRFIDGSAAVSYEAIVNICYKLKYNIDWMVAGEGPKKAKGEPDKRLITDINMFRVEQAVYIKKIKILEQRLAYLESQVNK